MVLRNVSVEELKKCYAACDVFVSTSQWEGFNLPLAEAQANGKPVIAYQIGAHKEVVKHGKTGFLAENDKEFVEYLSILLSDNSFLKSMGKEAATHAQKFNWKSHIDLYERLAKELIKQNH